MSIDETDTPARPGDGRDRWARVARWLLVAPAGLLGWQAGDVVGGALLKLAASLCAAPAAQCAAPWWAEARALAEHAGVAVGAALAVLLPVLTAPTMRGTIAWSAYGFVVAAAGHAAWMDDAWSRMLVVLVTGFAVLVMSRRRWRTERTPAAALPARRRGEEPER